MPFPLPPAMLTEAQVRLGVVLPGSFAARMQRDTGGELVAEGFEELEREGDR